MSKYNVYVNSECVWEGDEYDVALQEYIDCINEDPEGMIDLYEIDSYGNMICLEGANENKITMNVRGFAKWLLENFPEDAKLVSTNSLSWNSNEVKVLKYNDIVRMFQLKEKPEIDGEPTDFPCLVVHDVRRCDY